MPQARLALPALTAGTLVAALGSSIATVSVPAIVADFDTSLGYAQWVTLAYLLVSTVVVLPMGPLGDRIGRRLLLVWGLAAYLLAAIVAVTAPSLSVLVIARGIQGAAAAAIAAMALALVRDVVPGARVGRAMGLLGVATASGMALGPAVGGTLLGAGGWRAAFVLLVILPAVAWGLAIVGLPVDEATRPRSAPGGSLRLHLDLPGTSMLTATLVAYAIAMTLHSGGPTGTIALLVLSIVGAAIFMRLERSATYPLVALAHLRRLGILPQLSSAFVTAMVMIAYAVLAPVLLAIGFGLDPWAMGLVLAVSPLAAMATGWPAGRLVDRHGADWAARVGMVAIAAGAIALVVLPGPLGVAGVVLGGLILAPGNQLFMAGNATAVMTATSAAEQGVAAGLVTLARNVGSVTGASVMVGVFAWISDAIGSPPAAAAASGFGAAMGIGAVLVLGLAVSSRRSPRRSVSME